MNGVQMKLLIYCLFSLSLFSCGKGEIVDVSHYIDQQAPFAEDRDDFPGVQDTAFKLFSIENGGKLWPKRWTGYVIKAIEEQSNTLLDFTLKRSDLSLIHCSRYNHLSILEKQYFWVLFFAAISYNESSFNPKDRYWERGLGKYSEGLLQLSVDDSRYYTFCDLTKQTILIAEPNLRCGVSIMKKQIMGSSKRPSGELFPRSMFYWSVLTRESTKQRVINLFLKNVEKVIPECSL